MGNTYNLKVVMKNCYENFKICGEKIYHYLYQKMPFLCIRSPLETWLAHTGKRCIYFVDENNIKLNLRDFTFIFI
jgi:hypothetical protein